MVYAPLSMDWNFLLHYVYVFLAGKEILLFFFLTQVGFPLLTPSVTINNIAKISFIAVPNYFIMSSLIFRLNHKQ